MKRIKHLLLFVGTALFLAACGTGGNGGDNGGGQDGTLRFALNGVPSAAVEVLSGSDTVFDDTVENGDSTTLAAGSYSVRAGAVAGYNAPAAQNVTVVAGETVTVTLNYRAEGSDNGDNGTDPVTAAGVHVRVFPPEARDGATVSVLDVDGEVVESESGSGDVHFELDAAQDLRVQVSSPGYSTWTSEYFDLAEDETEDFRVTLAEDNSVSGNIARDGITFDFGDVDGNRYATEKEENPAKDAVLLAAQTEEQICVTVNVADEAGNPVRNAPVSVGLANDFWDAAIAYPGGCENELSAATSSGLGELYTDRYGNVTFSMQAMNAGWTVWQSILTGEREPIKVLVSAVGADGVAQTGEFKLFGLNMSHLILFEGDAGVDAALESMGLAETRLGHDYGIITNIWETGIEANNGHVFATAAYQKQPSTGPWPVPNSFAGDQDWFPGNVTYALVGDTDPDLFEWSGCTTIIGGGASCVEESGNPVTLTPAADVAVEDLPITATIRATYNASIRYGDEVYTFALKDYTVTKTWVGGFLEVDKYVTQHVLTWLGDDVTLPATIPNAGYSESNITSEYRSTVVVTVSNPSDATIYNVTVTDGVPAELGVIPSTISHGGTYSPRQHTVTWDNIPELNALDPDESVQFTFEVYARHKPGYCWDGGATDRYSAPELYYARDGQEGADCYAHDDPYAVTNGFSPRGNAFRTVSAAGYFEPGVGGQQHVYSYTPVADESTIWVVRPFFQLSKTLQSAESMDLNAAATFRIQARQLNRVSTAVDSTHTAYNALASEYPYEFAWYTAAGTGTGHRAPESVERNNPYAHDVVVSDVFEDGLDFTRGIEFNGTDVVDTGDNVQDQEVEFRPIANLHPDGSPASAYLTLQGVLHSDEGGESANEATFQLADGTYAWRNCAYLDAPQLNQPSYPDGVDELNPLVYAFPRYTGGVWANSISNTITYDPGQSELSEEEPYLVNCALVAVTPPPPVPVVGLNVNGEHVGYDGPDHADWGTQENVFYEGETWHYIYSFNNRGGAAATNLTVTLEQQDTSVTQFDGSALVYTATDPSGPWNLAVADTDYTVVNDSVSLKELAFTSLGSNEYIRLAVPGVAMGDGEGAVHFEITFDSGSVGPSIDDTTVIPGTPPAATPPGA